MATEIDQMSGLVGEAPSLTDAVNAQGLDGDELVRELRGSRIYLDYRRLPSSEDFFLLGVLYGLNARGR